jgi:hypothetical protein
MTRFDAAGRVAFRWGWGIAVLVGLGLLVPVVRWLAWSLLLGDLIGLLNVRMLTSAIRRGTARLRGAGATSALTVAGLVRFAVVLALLAWGITEGPHVSVWPLLIGLFLPEVLLSGRVLWGREPWDAQQSGQEGDSA